MDFFSLFLRLATVASDKKYLRELSPPPSLSLQLSHTHTREKKVLSNFAPYRSSGISRENYRIIFTLRIKTYVPSSHPFLANGEARAKRVWRRNANVGESEKARKTLQFFYDFFMIGNSIKLIILFFSKIAFSGRALDVAAGQLKLFNAFKDLFYCRAGRLENFHLEQ